MHSGGRPKTTRHREAQVAKAGCAEGLRMWELAVGACIDPAHVGLRAGGNVVDGNASGWGPGGILPAHGGVQAATRWRVTVTAESGGGGG